MYERLYTCKFITKENIIFISQHGFQVSTLHP